MGSILAKSFIDWSHNQLLNNKESIILLINRCFKDESIYRFSLGFNPKTVFHERSDWGLISQLKEDGKPKKLWLPAGIVIPTFSINQVKKIKVRRYDWKVRSPLSFKIVM
jgi:DNA primase